MVDDIHLALTAQEISNGLSEYFDMTCAEVDCSQIFDSLQHAQQHYLEAHGCDGFIRCCQKLFTRQRLVEEHIAWHKDKNIFRYEKRESFLTDYIIVNISELYVDASNARKCFIPDYY